MFSRKFQTAVFACTAAGALALSGLTAHADRDNGRGDDDRGDEGRVKKVFVIAMENHNWTQPASQTSPQPIFQNPAAPFINRLVNGSSGISDQVAYAVHYVNAAVGVHPSEPNYIWAEAGTNFGVNNDDDPFHKDCSPDTVQTTTQHLSRFLMDAGRTWKTYQEDTNVDSSNTPLAPSARTVPLFSVNGNWTGGINEYDYSTQFNYAAKHNPMVFFTDTNGGCDTTTANTLRTHYAPLQQLALDLQTNDVADYTWITPDQFNDQHTSLSAGYGAFPAVNDGSKIAQGDNFLSRVVPLIMASQAYQDHGLIVLWWDESEGGDDASRTLPFIVISQDVHPNVKGLPFADTTELSHSSTLRTMQEIFNVDPKHGFPWLGAAATASDLAEMFRPGVIK